MADPRDAIDELFRREAGHLVAALVRLLGPANLALAEDVVHDALVSALHAWRFGVPDDPKAWILQVAKRRAIDVLRRARRTDSSAPLEGEVELALSAQADAENQLSMMFAICDASLAPETQITLILRLLCGLSAKEIARAFLVDTQTIDRRLHRGRARLRERGVLADVREVTDVRARQPAVEYAIYLLLNEGYHEDPRSPALCADALRLARLLLAAPSVSAPSVHALAALCCFTSARLSTRVDEENVLVPLAEQDRAHWDRSLIERGIVHLGQSAVGDHFTRWHLEAGIALEHATAESVATTNWRAIVAHYDALVQIAPSHVVALNRAIAVAELCGVAAGQAALRELDGDRQLAGYSFYWAARADLARRGGEPDAARLAYDRAAALAKSTAERRSYERRRAAL